MLFVSGWGVSAQTAMTDSYYDSLLCKVSIMPDDENKLPLLDEICSGYADKDTVIKYSNQLLPLARTLGAIRYKSLALTYLSNAYYYKKDYANACQYSFRAIVNADTIGDVPLAAVNYNNLGDIYSKMQNAVKSDEFYDKAIMLYGQMGDSCAISGVLRSKAECDYSHAMYEVAKEHLKQAYYIDSIKGYKDNIVADYLSYGKLLKARYEDDVKDDDEELILNQSRYFLDKAYSKSKSVKDLEMRFDAALKLSIVLLHQTSWEKNAERRQMLLDSCVNVLDDASRIVDTVKNEMDLVDVSVVRALHDIICGRYDVAEASLDTLVKKFESNLDVYKEYLYSVYGLYVRLYTETGDKDKVIEYQRKAHDCYRMNRNADYAVASTQSMAHAEFDMRMREHVISEVQNESIKEAEKQAQFAYSVAATVLSIIILAGALVVGYTSRKRHELNLELDEKNRELEEQHNEILRQNDDLGQQKEQIEQQKRNLELQNDLVSQTNKEMKDSINYASVIQKAVMPSESTMNSIFGEHLLFYKPLHVVSGDFYWASQKNGYKFLAIADCTGHGVPGAFLSVLGVSILDSMVQHFEGDEVSAGKMLDEMRSSFERALHQRGQASESKDGIDIAFVVIDSVKQEMHFAGAYRPLVIIRDGELQKIDGDRMPIGVHVREYSHFTDHLIELHRGDVIYMYTDGVTDQFGYDSDQSRHKYSSRRLASLLTNVHRMPFPVQKMKFELEIEKWMMSECAVAENLCEQTDDELLVGIRV